MRRTGQRFPSERKEVLLVDDASEGQAALRAKLKRLRLTVLEAQDHAGALAAFNENRPKLLAAFLHLYLAQNKQDALALLAEMRRNAPEIPVVVYSPATGEDPTEAMERGAFWFLDKPDDDEEFAAALNSLLHFWQSFHFWQSVDRPLVRQTASDFLQRLIDNIPFEIMVRDKDYRVIWENRVKAERFGGPIPPGVRLLCKTRYQDACRAVPCVCDDAFKDGEPHSHYYTWRGVRDIPGAELYVTAAPMGIDPDGNPLVVETVRDVSCQVGFLNLMQDIAALHDPDRQAILECVVKHFVGEPKRRRKPGGPGSQGKIGFTRARAYLVTPPGGYEKIELKAWAGGPFCKDFRNTEVTFDKMGSTSIGQFWAQPREVRVLTTEDIRGKVEEEGYFAIGEVSERVGIPIRVMDHLAGIVFADKLGHRNAKGELDEVIEWEQLHWCRGLAEYLSGIFETIYQLEGMRWLLRTEREMSEPESEEGMFDVVTRRAKEHFRADVVQIHRIREGRITMVAGPDHDSGCLLRTEGYSSEIGINARACREKTPVYVEDCEESRDYGAFWDTYSARLSEKCPLHSQKSASAVAIPFSIGGRVVGTLCLLFNRKREFDPIDRNLLESLSASLSVGIGFAEAGSTIKDEARRKKGLEEFYQAEAKAASEDKLLRYCLTYLTADQGLRFNRALFFRHRVQSDGTPAFVFETAMGQVDRDRFIQIAPVAERRSFQQLLDASHEADDRELIDKLRGTAFPANSALGNAMARDTVTSFTVSSPEAAPELAGIHAGIGLHNCLVVGVLFDGKAVGAFIVDRPFGHRISESDITALHTFALHANQMFGLLSSQRTVGEMREFAMLGLVAPFVAHELKQPLAAARARVLGLDRAVARGDKEASQRLLRHLSEALKLQLDVVDALLSFCRTRSEPVDLRHVVTMAVTLVSDKARNQFVQVTLDVPDCIPQFPGFPGPLLRGVVNVLWNALNSTAARRKMEEEWNGGKIRVEVNVESDEITVRIEDDGIGMTQQQIDWLRTGGVLAPQEEPGIGFDIFRRAVELNGGRFEIQPNAMGGITIECYFKIRDDREGTQHAQTRPSG